MFVNINMKAWWIPSNYRVDIENCKCALTWWQTSSPLWLYTRRNLIFYR